MYTSLLVLAYLSVILLVAALGAVAFAVYRFAIALPKVAAELRWITEKLTHDTYVASNAPFAEGETKVLGDRDLESWRDETGTENP